MNAEDREDYKRLVAEAKDKEQDEISGEFIYRVKGAPGSFRVIKIRKRYTFKQRLDKFWIDQDVMYNYKADLHGIGNRSIIV